MRGNAMNDPSVINFDIQGFLRTAGKGRRIVRLRPRQTFFLQGTPAASVFYLQHGRAKLTVVSGAGKGGLRLATALAITDCTALEIERGEMIRMMHEESALTEVFMSYLLTRSIRIQADLVDQLFNSSEKRLARILLLMAEFGQPGEEQTLIPPITQEALADMIGTTRSRVSFFMNRFRKMGFIEYNGRIQVHKSLLNVILHDQPSEENARSAPLLSPS
jgi:CRP/FNR family transcriptional regulator, cyclic AMP receptor protein